MKKVVASFKRLAQKLHNSAFGEARIKRELKKHNECEDKPDDETFKFKFTPTNMAENKYILFENIIYFSYIKFRPLPLV